MRTIIRTAFGFMTIILCSIGVFGQKPHTVSGEVLDSANKPLRDARVDLIRGSESARQTKSDPDGTYSIGFDEGAGAPIDSVQYELTGWEPAVVSGLSGARDHRICKTLYLKGTKHNYLQAQEILSALETIYVTRIERGEKQEELRARFAPVIEKLNVPLEFENRVQSIRALYGMPMKPQKPD